MRQTKKTAPDTLKHRHPLTCSGSSVGSRQGPAAQVREEHPAQRCDDIVGAQGRRAAACTNRCCCLQCVGRVWGVRRIAQQWLHKPAHGCECMHPFHPPFPTHCSHLERSYVLGRDVQRLGSAPDVQRLWREPARHAQRSARHLSKVPHHAARAAAAAWQHTAAAAWRAAGDIYLLAQRLRERGWRGTQGGCSGKILQVPAEELTLFTTTCTAAAAARYTNCYSHCLRGCRAGAADHEAACLAGAGCSANWEAAGKAGAAAMSAHATHPICLCTPVQRCRPAVQPGRKHPLW